jgi:hypothetical protein
LALNGSVDPANSAKPALREEPRGLFEEILSLLGSVASYFQNLAALAGDLVSNALCAAFLAAIANSSALWVGCGGS